MTTRKTATPTLRTIADELGVSPATVSRVLSGQADRYRISRATQDAVRGLADRAGYVANEHARNLRLRRTATLGLVIPDVSNPFFARIARAVTLAARGRGYAVLVQDSQEQTDLEAEELETLRKRQVEGVVLCPVGLTADHLRGRGPGSPPVVLVDRVLPGTRLPCVTSDNEGGARAAAGHLFDAGHRVVGCLRGLPGTSTNDERLAGYKAAVAAAGLRYDAGLVAGGGFGEADGEAATRELLARRPGVTALVAFGNMIALGALRALAEAGRRLPADLSLVCFDDSPYAAHLACPLTTVAQDPDEMGRLAVGRLLDGPGRQAVVRVPTRLVARASVGPPREGK